MKQEKFTQTLFCIIVLSIVIFVSMSGCTSNTSNQNTNETIMQLSGTWVGTVEMPMVGKGGTASVSQITFTNNVAELTLGSTQRSYTMNYTYSLDGNTLVLEPNFGNRGGFPEQPPQNGTYPWNNTARPPMNETWPNGTRPDNGTRPPNWTRSENGTRNPGNGQPPQSVSFNYTLNEEHTILYLNGAEFRKN